MKNAIEIVVEGVVFIATIIKVIRKRKR